MNKPLSIGARLAIGYAAVFLLIVVLATLAAARVGQIDGLLDRIGDVTDAKQRYAANMRGSVHDVAIALRDVVLAPDAAAAATPIGKIKTLGDTYARAVSPLQALVHELPDGTLKETEALAAIREQERRARPLADRVIALHATGQAREAATLLSQQAAPALADWRASITHFIDLQQALHDKDTATARELASGFSAWILLLCAAAIAVGAPGAWAALHNLPRELQRRPEHEAAQDPVPMPTAAPAFSRNAEDIVSAIDGIAFQANIVALDAAVEAVRAGEQDGSVVAVAQEVQELAQRSAAVAQDIRALLGNPVQQAGDAGRLDEIADAVARLTAITGGIADGQRGEPVPLDEATRTNAALLHTAAAATALEAEAQRLGRTASAFLARSEPAKAVPLPSGT
ncbi:MCP four helix bundle domain-containing protein [Massilia consociata]|uniref:Methyl-accepting chemotaxis protein n=1 Tax=Massilia consociata TaxID=760117 RepID=A0ABV6FIP3_9BURK